MQQGIHFDKSRASAQSPSHTARRLLYGKAALFGEYIRASDIPNAYPRAPRDPVHRIIIKEPRRSHRTLTKPGKLILITSP